MGLISIFIQLVIPSLLLLQSSATTCDPSCLTCSGSGVDQCTSCKSLFFLTSTNRCACQDGKYSTGGLIPLCLTCDGSCATCSGPSSTACTGCDSGTFLYNSICYTNCSSSQFFNTATLACASCDPACLTCTGSSSSNCASCLSGNLVSGSCVCPTGTYKDSSYICQSCHASCKECSGPLSTQCTSCPIGMTNLNGQCTCATGKYLITSPSYGCGTCDAVCQACTGPSSSECTSCKNNLILSSSSSGNQCVCPSSTYYESSSVSCPSCSSSCKECTGPNSNQCTSCKNNMVLSTSTNTCGCLSGYYLDSSSIVCIECDDSCAECSGPSDTECTDCPTNFDLVSGECLCSSGCTCPSEKYYDTATYSCASCDSSCAECSGPSSSECTDCATGFTLSSGTCQCSSNCVCPDGQYYNLATFSCVSCEKTCKTCHGATSSDCDLCKNNLVYSSGQCICSDGTFMQSLMCINCDNSCKTCNGASSTSCTNCKNNMVLLSSGACGCSSGEYADHTDYTCKSCHSTCLECSGPEDNQCTSCKNNMALTSDYECGCASGEYVDYSDNTCYACHSDCQECSGSNSNQCTSCKNNMNLSSFGTCYCDSDNYMSSYTCYSCDHSCLECSESSDTDCTACDTTTKILTNGACLNICNLNQYRASDNSCQSCDPSCTKCSGPTSSECTACPYGKNLVNGECREAGCDLSCETCGGPSSYQCKTCYNSLVFLEYSSGVGQCLTKCPSNYYIQTQSNGQQVCLAKTLINNKIKYGSDATEIIVMMSPSIQNFYTDIIQNWKVSISFISSQPSIKYTFTPSLSGDKTQITLKLTFDGHLLPGNILNIQYKDTSSDTSTSYYLTNNVQSIQLQEYYKYSESTQKVIDGAASATTAVNQANGAFSWTSSFFMQGVHSIRSQIVEDMLSFFIYLNIAFPPNYAQFANSSGGYLDAIMPNFGNQMINSIETSIDGAIRTDGAGDNNNDMGDGLNLYYPNRVFLSNFGCEFSLFILGFCFLGIVEFIRWHLLRDKSPPEPKSKREILLKVVNFTSYSMKWNFMLSQFLTIYLELFLSSLVQIANTKSLTDGSATIEYIIGVVGVVFCIIGLFGIYFLIRKVYRTNRKMKLLNDQVKLIKEKEQDFLQRFNMLHKPFKTDRLPQMLYPFILTVRSFGYIMAIIFLWKFPIIQILYTSLTTVIVIAFLFKYKPLYKKSQQFVTVAYEVLFLLACCTAFYLHMYNQKHLADIKTRSILGFVLLGCNMTMLLLNFIGMFFELSELKDYCKVRKKQKVSPFSPISALERQMIDASLSIFSPQGNNEKTPLKKNQILPLPTDRKDLDDKSAIISVTSRPFREDDRTMSMSALRTSREPLTLSKQEGGSANKDEPDFDSNLSVIRDNSEIKVKDEEFESKVLEEQAVFTPCFTFIKKKRPPPLRLSTSIQDPNEAPSVQPNSLTFRSEESGKSIDTLRSSTEFPQPLIRNRHLIKTSSTRTLRPSPMKPGIERPRLMRSNSIESPTKAKGIPRLRLSGNQNEEAAKSLFIYRQNRMTSVPSGGPDGDKNLQKTDRKRDLYRRAILKGKSISASKKLNLQFNFDKIENEESGTDTPQNLGVEDSFLGIFGGAVSVGGIREYETNRNSEKGDENWQSGILSEKDDEPLVLDLDKVNSNPVSSTYSIPSTRRGILDHLKERRGIMALSESKKEGSSVVGISIVGDGNGKEDFTDSKNDFEEIEL